MTSAIITGMLSVLWILGWIFTVREVRIPPGLRGFVAVMALMFTWPFVAMAMAATKH